MTTLHQPHRPVPDFAANDRSGVLRVSDQCRCGLRPINPRHLALNDATNRSSHWASARAPGRVDLAGGWTDCPDYANAFGGAVVNFPITLYDQVKFTPASDGRIRITSRVGGSTATIAAASLDKLYLDGQLALLKRILVKLKVVEGGLLHCRSQVPPGGGLGSSAALAIAAIAAIQQSRGERMRREEICRLSHEIENEAGTESGLQDQIGSAHGGFNWLRFSDAATVTRTSIRVSQEFLNAWERSMLVVHSGHSHSSSRTLGSVMDAFRGGEHQVCAALHRLHVAAYQMHDAVRENQDLDSIGRILNRNWEAQQALFKRGVTDPITTRRIDEIFRVARELGMYGGKVLGAGGGGCLLLLCPPKQRNTVASAVRAKGGTILRANIDHSGLQCSRQA